MTGLDNGVEHTFEVRAVNAVGAGGVAEAMSTPATPVTVPDAPASLMATADDTQVSLDWTAPASDGGSAVTGYEYRYKTSGEFPDEWTDVPDGSDSGSDRSDERSYTVTGLDNGVLHTFEVRAVNVVGEGAPASATSTPMTTPTLPLSLDTIAGDDVVNIAEKAAGFAITGDTGSVGGASVTVTIGSGTLTATSAPSGAWTVTVPADASYVTGASVDITVNATLTGYNAAVELTSTLAVDLVRPSVQTAEVSGTSLELGYSEGLDGSSTPAADAFTVVKTDSTSATSTVGLASVDPVQVSGSVVTLTLDTAVPPGDTVTVDYTAPTGMGAMPVRDTAGNAVEALVAHAVANVPGAPASVEATAGDTQVTLAWTVPGSDGGSAVTEYQYRVSDDAGSTWSPDWTGVPDGSDSGTDRSDERSYTVTGLDNGVLHTFEVRAVNVVGEGAPTTATSTPVTVPGAPASLMATAGDTQVTLSWTEPASDGGSAVTEYQYRYKTSGEFPDEWTDVPDGSDTGADRSDETSYTVTGLDNGVEHTFEVRAVNVVGEGAPATATSTPVTVPEAPASLMATAGDTQVSLDWTAPASDGGSRATGYEYRVSVDGGSTWSPDWTNVPDGSDSGTDRSDERSYTVTGLDNGVEHTFEVRAVNVVGEGAPASATSTPVTVPGAPASLNATAGDTQVTLAWTEPASDGGSAVTGYEYRVSVDSGSTWSPDWTDVPDGSDTGADRSDETSFTVTGLDNGVLHTFEVRAVNVVGEGAPASATSTPMTTPTLPLSLDTIAGDGVVNIAEKAGGFTITGDTGSVGGASVTVTIDSGTLTATSAPSGAWTVTVPADASYVTGASVGVTVNATKAGYNAAVELTSTLALDLVRPSVQTAEVSGTSLKLGYSESLDGSSTPAADAFTVVKTDSSSVTSAVGLATTMPVTVSGSEVTLTLSSAVPPGDTVTVGYTVPTGMGAMPLRDTAGNAVEALVAHAVSNVPGAPASVEATAGDTQVTLAWTAPGSDGGSAVTGYQYRVSDDAGSTWSPDWTDVLDGSDTGTDLHDETSYTVTGLDNGVEHTFEVRAVNAVGAGGVAEAMSTPATPVTVPGAPASLMATAGDTRVTLSWTVPGSDGGSAVTEYQYRYKTSGEFPDEWTDVPDGSDSGSDRSDERFYTVTGLDNGVEHTFEVRAVNVVGDGAPASATATPLTGTRNLWPQFDETSTRENVQVMIPVLTNDTSPNRDSLEVISVTQPMNGTTSLISAISLVKYIPNDGFTGTDSFTYTVSDGLETATAAVRITVEASETDGDENQEWIATATTTLVTEGEAVAIDLTTTSQNAIVSEEQSLFATLQIGLLEGTVDEVDFQVEDSNGEILQSHTITPTIHHNGGWIHGLRWFPGKSVGSFRIRAKENEDSGSGNEYLVYWVYVEGLLVGSDVITIKPGT